MLAHHVADALAAFQRVLDDEGLVLRAVERRAYVVGHAAVHSHVGADARHLLHRPHGVEGEARVGHNGATRLDVEVRQRIVVALGVFAYGLGQRRRVLPDGGRLVIDRVRDAQAAAHVQLARGKGQLVSDVAQKLEHDAHGLAVAFQLEDLRADVAVKTGQLDVLEREGKLRGFGRGAVSDVEAELRVLIGCLDVGVGVCLDARAHAHDDLLDRARLGCRGVDALQLLVGVHHETRHARLHALGNLGRRLVVALSEDGACVHARRLCKGQLAAACRINQAALLGHYLVGGHAAEGLGRVHDGALRVDARELLHEAAQLPAQVLLIVDVEGGAVLADDVEQVHAAHRDRAAFGDVHGAGGDFQQVAGGQAIGLDVLAGRCDGHGFSLLTCASARTRREVQGSWPRRCAWRRTRPGVRGARRLARRGRGSACRR